MKPVYERAKKYADATDGCYDILSEEMQSFWRDDFNAYVQIVTEQRAIDIESFKKWATDNSFVPFDYYNDTEGTEEDRVLSFYDLMDYLKAMEE